MCVCVVFVLICVLMHVSVHPCRSQRSKSDYLRFHTFTQCIMIISACQYSRPQSLLLFPLCSGLFQVPMDVLSLRSTTNIFPSCCQSIHPSAPTHPPNFMTSIFCVDINSPKFNLCCPCAWIHGHPLGHRQAISPKEN